MACGFPQAHEDQDSSLTNKVHLENAPKFRQLIDSGCDVLHYKDGQI